MIRKASAPNHFPTSRFRDPNEMINTYENHITMNESKSSLKVNHQANDFNIVNNYNLLQDESSPNQAGNALQIDFDDGILKSQWKFNVKIISNV